MNVHGAGRSGYIEFVSTPWTLQTQRLVSSRSASPGLQQRRLQAGPDKTNGGRQRVKTMIPGPPSAQVVPRPRSNRLCLRRVTEADRSLAGRRATGFVEEKEQKRKGDNALRPEGRSGRHRNAGVNGPFPATASVATVGMAYSWEAVPCR